MSSMQRVKENTGTITPLIMFILWTLTTSKRATSLSSRVSSNYIYPVWLVTAMLTLSLWTLALGDTTMPYPHRCHITLVPWATCTPLLRR